MGSHIRTFEFIQGCPRVVVPDNLKLAVTRSHRYEPDINPTYADLLRHYGVRSFAGWPIRGQGHRENAAQRAEQWILPGAPLAVLCRPHQRGPLPPCWRNSTTSPSRNCLVRAAPSSRPLTAWRCNRCQPNAMNWQSGSRRGWRRISTSGSRAAISAPYRLVKKEVEVRLTARILEVIHQGERVASHPRSYREGSYTTTRTQLPEGHQRQLEWTPSGWCAGRTITGPIPNS